MNRRIEPVAGSKKNRVWERVRQGLRQQLGDAVDEAWFGELSFEAIVDGEVRLAASTSFLGKQIERRFDAALLRAWQKVVPSVRRVIVVNVKGLAENHGRAAAVG